ncbi:MAG TPA: hypothetical protein VLR90_13035 [Blastocatellia bacterium]|nr:hypothetical protein [Blastocatellia bacterium]
MRIKNNACPSALLFKTLLVSVIAVFALTFANESVFAGGSSKANKSVQARNRTRLHALAKPQTPDELARQIATSITDMSMSTLQAGITMTTTQRRNTTQKTTWSGTFYGKRADNYNIWIRIQFRDPGPDILIQGTNIKVYVPKTNVIIDINAQKVKDAYPIYIIDPTEMLGDNYDLKMLPKKQGYTVIKATPKYASDIEYAIISVAKVNGVDFPVKFEVVQRTITRTISLSGIRHPDEIPNSLFQLNYPGASSMPIR